MGYIVFSGLAFIAALMFGLGLAFVRDERDNKPAGPLGFAVGYGLITVIWLVISGFLSIHIVDSKEIGVIKTFGRITGQTSCHEVRDLPRCGGLTITWPWQSMQTWNVREDSVNPITHCSNGMDHCIDAGDLGSQPLYINPTVTIKISPDKVQYLAADLGEAYKEKRVHPLTASTIKAITVKYAATDVLQKRVEIEEKVRDALRIELAPYSIDVVRVTFNNVEFSKSFNDAIALKSAQTQKALEEETKVLVIQQQAKQAEEQAKGLAAAAVAKATGDAEANRILTQSLTPLLLQWQAVNKFTDNVQIVLVPSGEGMLLDPSTFLRQVAPK